MSTIESDAVTAATGTNTNLALTGKGTGKVALGDAALLVPDADGAAGQILTTNGSLALTFAATPGTSGNVLTSNGSAWTSAAAAGGGAWTLIGTAVASGSASLTITGLDSTYDSYAIAISDLVAASAGNSWWMRVGDSSGIDSSADEYAYDCEYTTGATYAHEFSTSNTKMVMGNLTGCSTSVDDAFGAMFFLHRPLDGTSKPTISGSMVGFGSLSSFQGGKFMGGRKADIDLDRIQILNGTGNIASGRLTVWGIAHA
ncbi:MAG: hypothetical protein ABGY96_24295 [bacterium]